MALLRTGDRSLRPPLCAPCKGRRGGVFGLRRDQPDLLELGQAVRQARVEMGLTQAQLSLVSGTSRDTIIALENGRSGVSLGNALQVLKGLGLTLVPKERG